MPSVSKAQQRFMGLVHAYKKGEVPASQVSKAVKDAAKSMKKKSTKKFAGTKHKGLPNKVRSEYMNEDGHTDVASIERKLKLIMQDAMDTLNALRGLSNEDSLPSWWTDKITLAKDYVAKSRDYIMNPAESVNEAERKMSSLEMQQIILLAKAMREMPGSPAQKKIKKQINVIRKKLGQAPVKESVNEADLKSQMKAEMDKVKKHREAMRKHSGKDKDKADRALARMKAAQARVDKLQDKIIGIKRESVNEISSYGEYVEDNARMLAQDYRRQDKKLAKALDHVADRINQSYPGRNRITKDDVKDIIKQPYDRKLMRPMMRFNLDDLFESVNETPQKVAKLLIKYGNNTKDVKDMIKKHYKKAKKDRSKSTPSELANYISFLSANESVSEATSLGADMLLGGIATVIKKAGMRPKTAKMMGGGFKVSKRDKVGFKIDVEIRGMDKKKTFPLQFETERGMLYVVIKNKPIKLGKYTMVAQAAQNLKKVGTALIGDKDVKRIA